MGLNRRVLAVLAGAAIVAGIAVTAASGAHRATPGVSATTITIGGTFPLTGPASLYKTIPAAESAYFAYVNDHGGVNGRKIDFKVLDDSYSPAKTVPLTQQLVEQDNVFAIFGSLGTAPNLSIWSYLNSHKVPQALIATGDSYWGFSHKAYPWTIGYQPDYPGEAKIYGQYLNSTMPNAKIGVLYQNDAYGKNYYAGLRVGLGAKKTNIVSAQSYDATSTSVAQQVLALKAAGANVFVVFALPTQTIGALVTATKVGWTPDATIINNVSANPVFLKIAAANGGAVDGVLSTNYLNLVTTANQNTAGAKLAKAVRSGRRVDDGLRGQAGRQEPHAGQLHQRAQEPQQRHRPVRLSGDQAADHTAGQLPDRAARLHQVGRRRDRTVDAVRQALQPRQVGRQTPL